MTQARTFDELTSWHQLPVAGFGLGFDPGWRPTGGAFDDNISRSDPYWGRVLDKAKTAYGDPHMHYDTADPHQDRHLVFADGTRVPPGGQLAYHDTTSKQTYVLNEDGSVSPLDGNGQAGQPIFPAGFRKTSDGTVAPVDAGGRQVAPLAAQPPPAPHGYHDQDSVLTPRNARGDYYVDDPARGERQYFDATGKPISEQQFRDGSDRPSAPPSPQPLVTDEQQSGRAADAVRKLHEELKNRYDALSTAESGLSEALLNAHAATTDGQEKLNTIQQKIVSAVNNPALRPDTPAGEQAFLKFLRGQVAAIGDVLSGGALLAEDQSKALAALTKLYAVDPPNAPADGPPPQPAPEPITPAPAAAPVTPSAPAPPDVGPEQPLPDPALPDPTLSDLGLNGVGSPSGGADPLASLVSSLPAGLGALSPLAGLGSTPLASLGELGGLAGPLAGLAAQAGDPGRRDQPDDEAHDSGDADHGRAEDGSASTVADKTSPDAAAAADRPPPPEPQPSSGTGDHGPPADTAPAPAPTTTVALPDGSTVTAHTPALAAAVSANLSGQPIDAAYQQAGLELPPPGTPVSKPVDPARLSAGMIGMFKDHYVVALSSVKALQGGQVVPLSAVGSGPDFLGWMDPAASAAAPVTVGTTPQ
jgi:Domain of unknown function (DUF4226)